MHKGNQLIEYKKSTYSVKNSGYVNQLFRTSSRPSVRMECTPTNWNFYNIETTYI